MLYIVHNKATVLLTQSIYSLGWAEIRLWSRGQEMGNVLMERVMFYDECLVGGLDGYVSDGICLHALMSCRTYRWQVKNGQCFSLHNTERNAWKTGYMNQNCKKVHTRQRTLTRLTSWSALVCFKGVSFTLVQVVILWSNAAPPKCSLVVP